MSVKILHKFKHFLRFRIAPDRFIVNAKIPAQAVKFAVAISGYHCPENMGRQFAAVKFPEFAGVRFRLWDNPYTAVLIIAIQRFECIVNLCNAPDELLDCISVPVGFFFASSTAVVNRLTNRARSARISEFDFRDSERTSSMS